MLANSVAAFGQNSGAGVAGAIDRGLARKERKNLLELDRQAHAASIASAEGIEQQQAERDYLGNGYSLISGLPKEQQQAAYGEWYQGAQQKGFDLTGVHTPEQYSEQTLNLMGFGSGAALGAQGANKKTQFIPGSSIITQDENGQYYQGGLVQRGDQLEEVRVPITAEALVSDLGQTAEDQANTKVTTHQNLSNIDISEHGAKKDIDIDTAGDIAQSTARGGDRADREKADISRARDLGKGLPALRRSMSILQSVKTGGFAKAKLAATNFFGITGADAGELSRNLGRGILGQLKEVFGAQFTDNEGRRLEDIEANFGQSAEANMRLIAGVILAAEDAIRVGIDAANAAGDTREAEYLESLLTKEFDAAGYVDEFLGGETPTQLNENGRASIGDVVGGSPAPASAPAAAVPAAAQAPAQAAPAAAPAPATTYTVGQIVEHNGKSYRVTGGDLNDPVVELVE